MSNTNLRTAIVTAASRGIGKAIAMQLARDGVQVAMCSSDAEAINHAAEEVRNETDANVQGFCLDLANGDAVGSFVGKVAAALGAPDILVYNPAPPRPGSLQQIEESEWQHTFELMLASVLKLTKDALPHMQKNQWGRIVFMGSTATSRPVPDLFLSTVYRSAIDGLARTLMTDLGPGVTINSVYPGNVLTDRLVSLFQMRAKATGQDYEEYLENQARISPVGRLGAPQEVADLVAFLVSERAGFIHGAMIPIDGGYVALPPKIS